MLHLRKFGVSRAFGSGDKRNGCRASEKPFESVFLLLSGLISRCQPQTSYFAASSAPQQFCRLHVSGGLELKNREHIPYSNFIQRRPEVVKFCKSKGRLLSSQHLNNSDGALPQCLDFWAKKESKSDSATTTSKKGPLLCLQLFQNMLPTEWKAESQESMAGRYTEN